ncbi:MAG: hypothetical protein JW751_01285 [Polyangiaceae bacterium]|nr:hypothetical protein [Polyangiaceae bacterium]
MTSRDPGSLRARRGLVFAAAGIAGFIVGSPARAANDFGAKGQLAITGEEVVGYFTEHRKWENYSGVRQETNRGGLALALQQGGARLGFHYFLLPQFSVGGTVGYDLRTGKNSGEDGDGTYSYDLAPEHTLLVGLRAGYALMFTDVVGFWFRAGPAMEQRVRRVTQFSEEDKDKDTVWLASLDILFAVTPVPHFGFYLGPSGDIAFAGQRKQLRDDPNPPEPEEWHEPESYQRLGVAAGLIGYF